MLDLNALFTICRDVMQSDQYHLQKRIKNLQTQQKSEKNLNPDILSKLVADIEQSLQRRQQRALHLPTPTFPDDLPICGKRVDIAAAIQSHPITIIAGETGSGKTTQIPKICLTLGLGVRGMIGCTQPRRIAARTVAQRVASELNSDLGHVVGYKVRFHDRLSAETYIKFMTDGILLAETQHDRFLNQYDTIIIDEAHERSLNIDFLLGYLKQLSNKRPDLKIIITSATIDTQRFSAHFGDAPIIEVSGRTYPVEVRYRPLINQQADEQDRDLQQAIADAVDEINLSDPRADILIFLATEREIHETADNLHKHRLPHTEILPLYARLSTAEQNRVFHPENQRRIILATNVAETSLTVPRIKAVIDTGFARISRYSLRSKVQRLPIEPISRSSADQRKGRCGRIAAGLCIRLYAESDYAQRPLYTEPEILRSSLAAVILQMLALQLGDIYDFPFIDPPNSKMINDGFTLLIELGAVDAKRQLTEIGKQLAKMPIDPRIGRMILAGKQGNCLQEILIIASALSIQDPRERPADAKEAADAAQAKFLDENSDFLSFLKIWRFFTAQEEHLSNNKIRQLCHSHFIAFLRWREWQDIHHQLMVFVKEEQWQINELDAEYQAIHCALLAGLLGNIAFKSQEEHYLGTRSTKLFLFPASGLFKKNPKWIMAAELVETTKLYARCVAKIEVEWVEPLAGHLCQRSYFEPHWEKKSAQVAAFEKVTLYGLTLVAKRRVNYGAIDPKLAREIFIRSALVEGHFYCQAKFFQHNFQLLKQVEGLEHKARRLDILADEQQLFEFYAARIPAGIYSGHSFDKWLKVSEKENPTFLFLSHEDVMLHEAGRITDGNFPDVLMVNGVALPLRYHFDPASEEDGVTVQLPLVLLNQLTPQPFEWLVRGFWEEKIVELIRSLPKSLRKLFIPAPEVAAQLFARLPDSGGNVSFYQVVAGLLQGYCGQVILVEQFNLGELPVHLLMNFELYDNEQKFLGSGRSLQVLQEKWGKFATQSCRRELARQSGLEREGVKKWDFPDLPVQLALSINNIPVLAFPTLVDKEVAVDVRISDSAVRAAFHYRRGFLRLCLLQLPLKHYVKQLPIDHKLCLQYMKVGNCEKLKEDMLLTVAETVCLTEPLPRTRVDFEKRLAQAKVDFFRVAAVYADELVVVLTEYAKLSPLMLKLESHREVLQGVQAHLNHLIYDGFVRDVTLEQLKQVPRYLRGIQLRLERLPQAPHKDAKKQQQIEPYWRAYWHERGQAGVDVERLSELRWMLEEWRVSLFAQELRTAYPISAQRVQEAFAGLGIKVGG